VGNPFYDTLDRALRGKWARVHTDYGVFEGWVARLNHGPGSVVLFDATETESGEDVGNVYIRNPEVVTALRPRKRVEFLDLGELTPHPDYPETPTPKDRVVRSAYRNQFAGSFPVVDHRGTIINGHKRINAALVAGLERHPVEVVEVDEDERDELFRVAHREMVERTGERERERRADETDANGDEDRAA
jgi:ParB family chromosome partitioning protein